MSPLRRLRPALPALLLLAGSAFAVDAQTFPAPHPGRDASLLADSRYATPTAPGTAAAPAPTPVRTAPVTPTRGGTPAAPAMLPAPLLAPLAVPRKLPFSVATPPITVVGAAAAAAKLPATIDTAALAATGMGDTPLPVLPATITTPGLQVSGNAP